MQDLDKKIDACTKCVMVMPLKVKGEGPASTRMVLVGDAPGANEEEQNRPFVGAAGKLLRELMLQVGIEPSSVFMTNAVKCHPPENRKPDKKEVADCLGFLQEQIRRIKPTVIVALGDVAARALTGKDEKVGDLRGGLYEAKGVKGKVLVTWHPAGLLKVGAAHDVRKQMLEDLNRAKEFAAGIELEHEIWVVRR